jgi:hypothetical protein
MMLASLSKPTREGRPKYLRQREAQKEGQRVIQEQGKTWKNRKKKGRRKKERRWRALRKLLRTTEAPCL